MVWLDRQPCTITSISNTKIVGSLLANRENIYEDTGTGVFFLRVGTYPSTGYHSDHCHHPDLLLIDLCIAHKTMAFTTIVLGYLHQYRVPGTPRWIQF